MMNSEMFFDFPVECEYNKARKLFREGMMNKEQKAAEYLKECGVFYMATVEGKRPRVRPMNGVMLWHGHLSFAIDRSSQLYLEVGLNPYVEISAVHPDRSYISLRGTLWEEKEGLEDLKKIWEEDMKNSRLFSRENMMAFALEDGHVMITDFDGKRMDSFDL